MHDRARVHLLSVTVNVQCMYICCDQSIIVSNSQKKMFSLLDLKIPSDAPEQEFTLHTTFGKNAKGLEHLSANIPHRIIELSVRQWRNHVW